MTRNPLRELLTRIVHDPAFDQGRCIVECRDFDATGGIARIRLSMCRIEAKNLLCGDSIIPFHRIARVTYENKILYPFEREILPGEG